LRREVVVPGGLAEWPVPERVEDRVAVHPEGLDLVPGERLLIGASDDDGSDAVLEAETDMRRAKSDGTFEKRSRIEVSVKEETY
jgi:hypothetical protein